MNSKTQYEKIEWLFGGVILKPSNTCNIWVQCRECEKKDEDEITMECKPGDKLNGYFIFQCQEARDEMNDNLVYYCRIIRLFANLLDEKKRSSSYCN